MSMLYSISVNVPVLYVVCVVMATLLYDAIGFCDRSVLKIALLKGAVNVPDLLSQTSTCSITIELIPNDYGTTSGASSPEQHEAATYHDNLHGR